MRRTNRLKRRLAAGEAVAGLWLQSGSATLAEIAVLAGFEAVLIDNEHGPASLETTLELMRAVEAGGGTPIVRVPWNDPVYLKRILDLGAASLMIPMVESVEAARAAVEACRYPPRGRRGYAAPIARAAAYGLDADYLHHAHDDLLLMLQIETAAAVSAVPDIAAVDGVDLLFIGPNDLAGSIDRLEALDAPDAAALIAEAEGAIRAAGTWMGTIPRPGAAASDLYAAGHRLVLGPSDLALFRAAAVEARGAF